MTDTMSINGREYVAIDSLPPEQQPDIEDGGVRIVILQRGWVVVGHYYRDGDQVRIENAAVVRRWGTDCGLGQLATSGPLPNTTLDNCPTIRCHQLAVLSTMDCQSDKWEDRL